MAPLTAALPDVVALAVLLVDDLELVELVREVVLVVEPLLPAGGFGLAGFGLGVVGGLGVTGGTTVSSAPH